MSEIPKIPQPPIRNPIQGKGGVLATVWSTWFVAMTRQINTALRVITGGTEGHLTSITAGGSLGDSGISVNDVLEPKDVKGTTDKISVTDNGDGTITLNIAPAYLSGNINGTTNQIIITPAGDGSITLSTPQDLHTDTDFELNSLQFDLDPTGSPALGRVAYNPENRTWDFGLLDGVVGQLFYENFIGGQNDTGLAILDGKVATYAGGIGNSGNIRVELTVANAAENPIMTLGIFTHNVANGGIAAIATGGKVRGIQTDGVNYGEVWTEDQILYKSSTIQGGLTNVPPNAPIPAIPLAVVVAAHATNGTLEVRPTFPQAYTMLTDVNGTPATTTGQFGVWDQVNKYFDLTYNILDYQLKDDFTEGSVLFRGAIEIDEDNSNFFWDVPNARLRLSNLLINGLTASKPVWTDPNKILVSKDINVAISYPFDFYDAQPARGSETNWHGGLNSLATGQPLDSVPTDLVVTKGIGKVVIVVNAGTDLMGDITITGTSVDRDTGVSTPADTDTISVNALTTDSSTTDANGNIVHVFTEAYISSKWFHGTVTLSTTDLTLTDVDVYHCSFEQCNDDTNMTLNTIDANLFTTNANAEFDCYLFGIRVAGDKCDLVLGAELHVGADGFTAIANKYEHLRKGNINEPFDGTTDGWWVDIHYSNSPSYVEDVTVTVWATKAQIAT